MFRSLQVARIGGIAIEIHLSWLLILAFITWTLSDGFFPNQYAGWSTATYWIIGTLAALLLFVTVLVHELAHAVIAIRRGLPVPKITLFIFGGASHLGTQPRTAGEEFKIAAAGPATSLLIALVAGGAALALRGVNEQAEAVATYLAGVNVLLAVFNILPGFPLDGGRVLRAIAWKRTGSFRRATRIAGGVGELFGYVLLAAGVLFLLNGYGLDGLWFIFIGWFLLAAARSETQNLQLERILGQLKARDIMHTDFASVQPGASLQTVVDDYMLARGERAVVVANGGAVHGMLTVTDIAKVPRDEWPNVPAQRVMTPRADVITVTAATSAHDVLLLVGEKRIDQVPVLDEGRMVGMITRRELLDRIQLAQALAPDAPEIPENTGG